MKKLIALTITFVFTFAMAVCGAGVADVCVNIFKSSTYHMKWKILGGIVETVESYKKNGMVASVIGEQGQTMRMVMRDNKIYSINDSEKTVLLLPTPMQAGLPGDTTEDNADIMNYIGSGTADFQGKNLAYDEYSVGGVAKRQFFVDSNKLAGMRYINDGFVVDMVVLELDQNVPDSAFEIPAGYIQTSF